MIAVLLGPLGFILTFVLVLFRFTRFFLSSTIGLPFSLLWVCSLQSATALQGFSLPVSLSVVLLALCCTCWVISQLCAQSVVAQNAAHSKGKVPKRTANLQWIQNLASRLLSVLSAWISDVISGWMYLRGKRTQKKIGKDGDGQSKSREKGGKDAKREREKEAPPLWPPIPPPRDAIGARLELVDSSKWLPAVQTLLNDPLGSFGGRDQRVQGVYSTLRVEKVYRVINPAAWRKYCARREELHTEADAGGRVGVRTDMRPNAFVQSLGLHSRINEKLLFHGTKAQSVDKIVHNSLDFRVSQGAFGFGVYLAEFAAKSDQYCSPSSDGSFWQFLVRASLGAHLQVLKKPEPTRRRPDVRDASRGKTFDSVVVSLPMYRYREFVLYDGAQAYPEFVVKYKRV
uniref:Poly [ADP-ribose] polymerase n=1 Tax=Chromera velia CCMP2878 TaxID=1169474 RepID=A0A0G4HN06_9ALVE|mmetsp:Transcript_36754/g.72320  ORF Transcript_36754/g.72320 Transcript_36754/m.72320 type:complete len:400 (+) Transcript_36754:172-1371(+)|eukprot:Cvel_29463.t1-p1 / transcript=Cvel_29463.t1 / gene=Cvel_29463 / organism=Chromera_velia_CCMP2878 / gene_product=Tankyrase-2, putative / transcript_product=Tankyrase-2, putative / location=Cvel_scaffold4033:1912-3108(-) / protein_length=399 / sequence_SO=supercontig / SO=protein_coding / is_pseudo=false